MELEEVTQDVRSRLSEERFFHSMCVMDMCEELAKIYGASVDTAKRVGIAHDVAKELSEDERIRYVMEKGICVDEIEMANTGLLHAKIGSSIAIKEYGFTEEMGQAIEAHTTGKVGMSLLAKILYIADCIGADNTDSDVEYVREMAKKNLDEAIIYDLDRVIRNMLEQKKQIHFNSVFTRNWLLGGADE